MDVTYGTSGDHERVSFAGKTDPQIARELLSSAGFERERIEDGFEQLWAEYLTRLESLLPSEPVTVLPGVDELLHALAEIDDVGVGLLTGNIVGGARLKLSSGGLWDHFHFGSYGSDREIRDELPAVALQRASMHWGVDVAAEEAIVIGDTPRDVQCGHAGGTKTLAVATGAFGSQELASANPDWVLDDLSATEEVLRLLVA